jgi:hypothetical protein
MRWPLEDEIRWIEWRLRELERGDPCTAPLTAFDCRVWLAHKRDGKSYGGTARSEYPGYWKKGNGKRGNQKIISLVRRTVDRVERYLIDPTRHWTRAERQELADVLRVGSPGIVPIFVESSSPDSRAMPRYRKRT